MKGKDFTIGLLSVTATILLVGLVILHSVSPPRAFGYGQTATAGNFVVTTAQIDETTELLLVLDTSVEVMNAYGFNFQFGGIELVQQLDVRWPERDEKTRAKPEEQKKR